jgi:xylan 1,4-beta-xylosidase
MLRQLGDTLLARTDGAIVTRDSATGRVSALAYHYPDEEPRSVPASFDDREQAVATESLGRPRALDLRLDGLRPGAQVEIEVLDSDHGNAIGAWRSLGEPAEPTREQTAVIDRLARQTWLSTVRADVDGCVRVQVPLRPWAVLAARQIG